MAHYVSRSGGTGGIPLGKGSQNAGLFTAFAWSKPQARVTFSAARCSCSPMYPVRTRSALGYLRVAPDSYKVLTWERLARLFVVWSCTLGGRLSSRRGDQTGHCFALPAHLLLLYRATGCRGAQKILATPCSLGVARAAIAGMTNEEASSC